ncbi:MAG: LD-carboxypeptidase [Mycoplasmataceae bacterium]|nr:LD-carboxypeptidase [Mycoplasmataceae bacterium]
MSKEDKLIQQSKKITIGIYNSSTPIIPIFVEKAKRAEKLFISNNFEIVYGNLSFSSDDYRSGTPQERADEINELIKNKNVNVLLSSIGGNNTSSILEYLDYENIKKSKCKIIGHSDTTVLAIAIYAKTNEITYYGASYIVGFDNQKYINDFHINALIENCINDKIGLISSPSEYTEQFIPWTNENPVPNKLMKPNELTTVSEGVVEGLLIGGNLSSFLPMIGTEYFPKMENETILFFEETCQSDNLSLALVEKNIASLRNTGILHKIKGLIIGKCEGFEEISKGVKYYDFIKEFIYDLNIPILAEFDLAHTLPIMTIAVGSLIKLDATNKTITRLK